MKKGKSPFRLLEPTHNPTTPVPERANQHSLLPVITTMVITVAPTMIIPITATMVVTVVAAEVAMVVAIKAMVAEAVKVTMAVIAIDEARATTVEDRGGCVIHRRRGGVDHRGGRAITVVADADAEMREGIDKTGCKTGFGGGGIHGYDGHDGCC